MIVIIIGTEWRLVVVRIVRIVIWYDIIWCDMIWYWWSGIIGTEWRLIVIIVMIMLRRRGDWKLWQWYWRLGHIMGDHHDIGNLNEARDLMLKSATKSSRPIFAIRSCPFSSIINWGHLQLLCFYFAIGG